MSQNNGNYYKKVDNGMYYSNFFFTQILYCEKYFNAI